MATPMNIAVLLDEAADYRTDAEAITEAAGDMLAGARSCDVEVAGLLMDAIRKLQDRDRALNGAARALDDAIVTLRAQDGALRMVRDNLPRRARSVAA